MVAVPRLVVAAPRSGSGKTTVATGLMAALSARGHRVSPHKVGPDFIDPSYHAAAAGRPGRNLDPWLVGAGQVPGLFAAAAQGCDIAIVEGVMGMFDGVAGRGEFGSTAHVARLIDAPVVLIVDASGTARSIAAMVHGFASFDPGSAVAGVILTKVGSDRHELLLREALQESGHRVLGALRRDDALSIPARHLGLVPVAERPAEVATWLARLTAAVEAQVDLGAVVAVANSAPGLHAEPWRPTPGDHRAAPVRVAVATGAAFTFGYAETFELLAAAGAEVAGFDPVHDAALPTGTDALVVGGGFPEVYAEQLTANVTLREAVRALVGRGAPVVAECGGLLWLAATLDGREQCGVVPADAAMTPRLTLGYRTARAAADSPLAAAGTTVHAHEFHRTATVPAAGTAPGWSPAWRLEERTEGWSTQSLHASYLHVHWAGLPDPALRLVAAARRTPAPAPAHR